MPLSWHCLLRTTTPSRKRIIRVVQRALQYPTVMPRLKMNRAWILGNSTVVAVALLVVRVTAKIFVFVISQNFAKFRKTRNRNLGEIFAITRNTKWKLGNNFDILQKIIFLIDVKILVIEKIFYSFYDIFAKFIWNFAKFPIDFAKIDDDFCEISRN